MRRRDRAALLLAAALLAGVAAAQPLAKPMPAGHPAVADDADGEGDAPMPPGHPAVGGGGGAMPAGHGAAGDQAPEDVSDVARDLPAGVIVIEVRDLADKPVPNAGVTLAIMQQSVAKGESRKHVARTTDADGRLRFDGLETGQGIAYRVSVPWDRSPSGGAAGVTATFAAMPFQLDLNHGQRVVVHVSPVTSRIEETLLGVQSAMFIEMKDEVFQVEQVVDIVNIGRTTWVPDGVVIELPKGWRAFQAPQQMGDIGFDPLDGKGAKLRGTFPPGEHEITMRYQVPNEGNPSFELDTGVPPRLARMRVVAEATREMSLEATGFPAATADHTREGQRLLVTERQLRPGEPPMSRIHVALRNLPTMGPGRLYALGAAVLAVVAGLGTAFSRKSEEAGDDELRADALRARDRLVDELRRLDKLRASGELGPKTYERARTALVDALARVLPLAGSRPKA